MSNIEAIISWMNARRGRATYSMNYRNGPGKRWRAGEVFATWG